MENVYGLAYANHNRAILERFLAGVRGAGYSHDRKVILAADHGVPQIRQRLIVVGVRADLLDCPVDLWRFGGPMRRTTARTSGARTDRDDSLATHVSAAQALQGLRTPTEPARARRGH